MHIIITTYHISVVSVYQESVIVFFRNIWGKKGGMGEDFILIFNCPNILVKSGICCTEKKQCIGFYLVTLAISCHNSLRC